MKRAYDPEPGSGRVLVNGEPMQAWDVRDFRKSISVVSQQVNLFSGSIKDNILYGLTPEERHARGFEGAEGPLKEAGIAELERVCDMAACDFINDYPLRLETRLGTRGIKLSGGQKQCIAIARALIKRPALLILDEATAALDAKTQQKVAAAIAAEQARLGFTVVQIAHRLETLKDSDVIYYLSHGVVVEHGGDQSLSRRAVEELLTVPVETRAVEDPESGLLIQKLHTGFFHDMWNKAQGVQDVKRMAMGELAQKERELHEQLEDVKKMCRRKRALQIVKLRLLAVRAFLKAGALGPEH